MKLTTTPKGSRGRVSDPASEQEYAQALLRLLDANLSLYDDMNRWPKSEPGSLLFEDDQATYPFPISNDVRYLLLVAADNLNGLRSMILEATENGQPRLNLHVFAPYTLIRNAIECASTALWIMTPAERHERVLRLAQFELEDAKKNKAALTAFGGSGEETFNRKKGIIEGIIRRYAELSWKGVDDGFRITGLLRTIGSLPGLEGLNPLGKWQIASGMAHGKRWVGTLLSDLKEDAQPTTKGDSTFLLYGSFERVFWLAQCAQTLLYEASNQVIEKSQETTGDQAQGNNVEDPR
ncbi:hypothetical protein LFT44_21890 (plasmid) [Arthrobacter sp. FW306-05-C]|uniref:Uncharacterized protein n=1 Tax=Pseudarthrobacter enclensis TaxID=993070 RepID=A0ABT9RVF2_9MICC|nr:MULTISPECIES: hypothetical protein [Micrococcaceae]MDP9888638.1 hypothetical protein [Pseudarthrobacter enclensis]UKA69181.1 hypothetical protein LFT44_21890 [Arthrobacter sp. FW306-05-C]